jgi:hypothetical protein
MPIYVFPKGSEARARRIRSEPVVRVGVRQPLPANPKTIHRMSRKQEPKGNEIRITP